MARLHIAAVQDAIARIQAEDGGAAASPVSTLRDQSASTDVASRSSEPSRTAEIVIRPGSRAADIVAFEIAVASFFMDAADILGVPKSVAAIYGLCFASPQPLSFADLDERLEISSGSISQGIRVLTQIGALKKVGSHQRRDYYAPDLELRKLALHFIENRLEKQLNTGKARLRELKALIPAKSESGDNRSSGKLPTPRSPLLATETLKSRLKYLESWHGKARGLVPLAKTFLQLT